MNAQFSPFTLGKLLALPVVTVILAVATLMICSRPAKAELVAISEADLTFFENKIRPLLIKHCVECHGEEEQSGELRLDQHARFQQGGSSGPVVEPGKPSASRLIQSVEYKDTDLQMPPDGKLSTENISLLKQWVERGAPWPADTSSGEPKPIKITTEQWITQQQSSHWSYQPVVSPEPPAINQWPVAPSQTATVLGGATKPNGATVPLSSIDRFVAKKLLEADLSANPVADRRTLIIRAYFHLIGLPPSYEEVRDFIGDSSPDAFEKVIDHLLESPHYGERWARHWLDIARYGDTTGYIAGSQETRYPYAFSFRDYVIEAFNTDKPFNEFIIEQIAADRLNLQAEQRPSLAAMGFLTVGRRFMNRQVDIIDDQIDVVTRGFLGLSVSCARCHDHKYDAIPTADYYSLYGVFASSEAPSELPLLSDSHDSPEYDAFLAEKANKQKEVDQWLEERRLATEVELRGRIADYLTFLAKSLPQYANGNKVPMQGERGPLRPAATVRWRQYLTNPELSPEPIWRLLRDLSGIKPDDFQSQLQSLLSHPDLKEADLSQNPEANAADQQPLWKSLPDALTKDLIQQEPNSLPKLSRLVGEYLESVIKKWAEQAKTSPKLTELPNPQDEALRQMLKANASPVTLTTEHAVFHLDQGERNRYNQLKNVVNGVAVTHPGAPPRAMVLKDKAQPINPVIFKRGVASNRGDSVPRRFLQVLEMVDQGASFQNGSGRLELAKAIANPANPLTARVIINRIWQHHFGEGLVRTPSDFGIRGEPPTHPELLDYLASEFMRDGWSIKRLQKQIMLSKTWQQSSASRPAAFQTDPENRLLWKMPRQRLEFEPLRDRLLVAAQQLDTRIGGRSVKIHQDATRRGLYAYIDREDLPGLLASFDLPSPDASRAQRSKTTVPQQALYLMNSAFVLARAKAVAKGIMPEDNRSPDGITKEFRAKKIQEFYRRVLSRDPDDEELQTALVFTDPDSLQAYRANSETDLHSPIWQFGYGGWDATSKKLNYSVLPYFDGSAWKISTEFPHPVYSYLQLSANGGHTGTKQILSPIRRWTAPVSGNYQITGTLTHPSDQGDGVIAQIAKEKFGILAQWSAFNQETETKTDSIRLEKGEAIYLIVHLKESSGWDSFGWNPVINLLKENQTEPWTGPSIWNAENEFAAASKLQQQTEEGTTLDVWVQLAQAMMLSNEFAFVD